MENNDGTKITERVDIANRRKLARIQAATITVQSFKNIRRKPKKNIYILPLTTRKTTMYHLPLENYAMP